MKKQVYMPPEAKVIHLNNFDLSKIEEYFEYADFERRISKNKVHTIANAMMDNKFTDNVLRVCSGIKTSGYEVLDGQHRIEALRYARENFGLANYDLILMNYKGGNRREIYRRLNLGKPLTLTDHLKALDNGRQKFFNDMREYCDHYNKVGKLPYRTIINCLYYSKSTSIRPVRPLAIDDFIKGITDHDIKIMQMFLKLLPQVATNPDSLFYHYTLMRNYFRVYYENETLDDKMIALGDVLIHSSKIKEMAEKRDTYAIRGIYHYIIDIAGPKVGLSLSKGEVKK